MGTLGFAVSRLHRLLGADDSRCNSFADFIFNQQLLGIGKKSFAGPWVHRAYAAVFNIDIEICEFAPDGSASPTSYIHADEVKLMKSLAPILLPWCCPLHDGPGMNGICHIYVSLSLVTKIPHFDLFVMDEELTPAPVVMRKKRSASMRTMTCPETPLSPQRKPPHKRSDTRSSAQKACRKQRELVNRDGGGFVTVAVTANGVMKLCAQVASGVAGIARDYAKDCANRAAFAVHSAQAPAVAATKIGDADCINQTQPTQPVTKPVQLPTQPTRKGSASGPDLCYLQVQCDNCGAGCIQNCSVCGCAVCGKCIFSASTSDDGKCPKCAVAPGGGTVSPGREIACKLDQMLRAVDDTSDSPLLESEAVSSGPEELCLHAKTLLKFPGNVKGYVECDVLGHSSQEGFYEIRCVEMMRKEPNGGWGMFPKTKKQVLAGIKVYAKAQDKKATKFPPKSEREVALDKQKEQVKTLKDVVEGYLRLTRKHGKIVEAAKKLKDGTSFPNWTEQQLVHKIKNCLKIARKSGGVVHTPSMKG